MQRERVPPRIRKKERKKDCKRYFLKELQLTDQVTTWCKIQTFSLDWLKMPSNRKRHQTVKHYAQLENKEDCTNEITVKTPHDMEYK